MATARISHGEPHHAAVRPVRVMVVDDNPEFREGLIALLDTEGLEVIAEASSGKESLEMIENVDADIVLMDVRMPLMDGLTCTTRLSKQYPNAKVVIITGGRTTQKDAVDAGARALVEKPFGIDELGEIIHLLETA